MSSARVLIVEDNPLNLKLVRDVLLNAGFGVIERERRGRGGAAQDSKPDVILMDLQLRNQRDSGASADQERPERATYRRRPDCLRYGGGSRRPARRVRRLPQQADQRS